MKVFTQPLCHRQDVTQGQFLNGVKLVWIQCFPSWLIALTRRKKPVCLTNWFMLVSRTLAWNEMQTALFRIWTLATDSISYNKNCYTKCAPQEICICVCVYMFICVCVCECKKRERLCMYTHIQQLYLIVICEYALS